MASHPKYRLGLSLSLLLSVTLSAAPDTVIKLAPNLFDHSNRSSLGLDFAKNTKSYRVYSAQHNVNKYNHGAVLIPFKGKLYVQWQSSLQDEDAADTHVMFSSSLTGEAWAPATRLAPARQHANVTSGGWWTDKQTLIAFINVWPNKLKPKTGYVEYLRSTDGEHWSEPKRITMADGDFVEGIIEQDLHRLPNGRILTALHAPPGLIVTPFYTNDSLAISNWKKGTMPNLPHSPGMSRELEPSSFLKKDKTIVMVFRDQASSFRVLASHSSDNAQTWSRPLKTDMPDSRSKQSAGNLPSGKAFIINNPSGSKARYPLVLSLSDDGHIFDRAFLLRSGKNMPKLKYPGRYKRTGFSYPKSVVWKNFLYVGYAVNKEDIAITRVPLDALN